MEAFDLDDREFTAKLSQARHNVIDAEGARVLMLLGGFLWLWFGTMTFGWALTAADHLRDVLRANCFAMLVNVAVNLALIPKFGYWGAAVATVVSEVFLLAYFLRVFLRLYGNMPHGMFPVRAIPAALTLAVVAWELRTLNLGIVIAAGAAAYFAVLFLSRALNEQERRIIWQLVQRKRD